ncbi:hypothetical protein [Streptomyces sp. TRM49041]|uniref:hypothetical protein n=1 Tax=Streptomyces sp. TRM49041 TaxID=2603216 RepID=UPI0016568292
MARRFLPDAPAGRAIVFTDAPRSSLVILPLAPALPHGLADAADRERARRCVFT